MCDVLQGATGDCRTRNLIGQKQSFLPPLNSMFAHDPGLLMVITCTPRSLPLTTVCHLPHYHHKGKGVCSLSWIHNFIEITGLI